MLTCFFISIDPQGLQQPEQLPREKLFDGRTRADELRAPLRIRPAVSDRDDIIYVIDLNHQAAVLLDGAENNSCSHIEHSRVDERKLVLAVVPGDDAAAAAIVYRPGQTLAPAVMAPVIANEHAQDRGFVTLFQVRLPSPFGVSFS
jgi:hypothetical protein